MTKNCGCGKDPCETYGIKEDAPANSVSGGGIDFAPTAHGMKFRPINATDRRHKKKTVMLKRFRDYIKQNG